MSLYKCGFDDGEPEHEDWKAEISCNLVGCKNCQHFKGEVHFHQNVKKGLAMWAKKETEQMRGDKSGN